VYCDVHARHDYRQDALRACLLPDWEKIIVTTEARGKGEYKAPKKAQAPKTNGRKTAPPTPPAKSKRKNGDASLMDRARRRNVFDEKWLNQP